MAQVIRPKVPYKKNYKKQSLTNQMLKDEIGKKSSTQKDLK
jgi:hypothetical protein